MNKRLLETKQGDISIVVETSESFIKQLSKGLDIEIVKEDILDALGNEEYDRFSPDKSDKTLKEIGLFLYHYENPSMGDVPELKIKTKPPKKSRICRSWMGE